MGQPPPQQVSGYDTLPRQDAGGNDIKNIDTNDINVCSDECNNLGNCKGFNFNGKTCWIKNNVDNKAGTPDWNLYVKKQVKSTSNSVSSASDNTMLYMGLLGVSCCCFIFIIIVFLILKKKK